MKLVHAAFCLSASVGLLVAVPTSAHATTGQHAAAVKHTSASACLQGLSGPYDIVNTFEGIVLKCGDHTKGILHIDDAHPISESGHDDVNINRCMDNILYYGSSTPASSHNSAKKITRPSGGYAIIVWDTASKNVVTMYTSDGRGNNWAACAAFPH